MALDATSLCNVPRCNTALLAATQRLVFESPATPLFAMPVSAARLAASHRNVFNKSSPRRAANRPAMPGLAAPRTATQRFQINQRAVPHGSATHGSARLSNATSSSHLLSAHGSALLRFAARSSASLCPVAQRITSQRIQITPRVALRLVAAQRYAQPGHAPLCSSLQCNVNDHLRGATLLFASLRESPQHSATSKTRPASNRSASIRSGGGRLAGAPKISVQRSAPRCVAAPRGASPSTASQRLVFSATSFIGEQSE